MNVLFVANFGPDVGYAWRTIDAVYRRVGAALQADGINAFICYPSLDADAAAVSGATSIAFDYARALRGITGLLAFLRLLRRHRIRILYLTDRTHWTWRYLAFHLAGVRRIVVHDRTSGERAIRPGVFGVVKRTVHRLPGGSADCYIGISQFVAHRLMATGVPPARVRCIYNGIELDDFAGGPDGFLHDVVGESRATRIVFASGRAQDYKGIGVLIDAAAQLERAGVPDVAFVYCGDGTRLDAFRAQATALGLRRFHFLGRREDVPRLLRSATVAVVPSLWAEAFGLTVVEAMAAGVPVVATRVGGIPELIEDGRSGLLVPPGDAEALAAAVRRLLDGVALRGDLARNASADARARFAVSRTVSEIAALLRELLGLPPRST